MIPGNRYVHLLLNLKAIHFLESVRHFKSLFKRISEIQILSSIKIKKNENMFVVP